MPTPELNPRTPDDDSIIQGRGWFSRLLEGWIVRATPTCTDMTRLISHEMDAPLPLWTRLRMRVHYLTCCYCHRYKLNLHFMRRMLRGTHDHASHLSSEVLPPEARERIRKALQQHE